MEKSMKDILMDGQESFHFSPQQSYHQLEQFTILAKSAKGAACLELIKQVLEAPGVNVFGELLEMPNINAMEHGPNDKYYKTLHLFAYGTYKQYLCNPSIYLDLSPAMKKKLQHLTMVTMAMKTKCIPYQDLLEELNLNGVRDLEDLIIEAIYADVIHGKLDQKNRQFEVDYAIGRDIRADGITPVVNTLEEWCQSCESVLQCIEEQINRANIEKSKRLRHKEEVELEVVNLKKSLKSQLLIDSDEAMVVEPREPTSCQEVRKKPIKTKVSRQSTKSWFKPFT